MIHPLMTPKAECFLTLNQQLPVGRLVRIVAGQAIALVDRTMGELVSNGVMA